MASRLARALWIEIDVRKPVINITYASRLARALWIEIDISSLILTVAGFGRGSREPCGLKYYRFNILRYSFSRGSREPCGLK